MVMPVVREVLGTTNPHVHVTSLRAYPGWLIREYQDGMFDVAHSTQPWLSPGLDSWGDALAWVRTASLTPGCSG